jgi:Kef-type K+ transport system membrane component KefB
MIQDQIIVRHHHERLVDLIKPLNYVLVPIFFVYAGMQVDLVAVANWSTLVYGFWLSLAAIGGKLISGVFLPKSINRWIVGFGMVPRGEIGLIFALTGRQLGVFSSDVFAAVLLMVVITSIVTPLALQFIVKRGLK